MINFGDRLKNARKMKGLSLQDLSDRMQNTVSKQDLSRFENGDLEPDSKNLESICSALDVTLDYFFRNISVSLENIEFRKLKRLSVKEGEKIKSCTSEYLERYFELESIMGIDNTFPFPQKSYKINSSQDIENAAQNIRNYLHCGNDPIFNLVGLLEDYHIKVIWINAPYSFSGLSTIINNKVGIIVLNSNDEIPVVRKRFTALHELGHLVLDLSNHEEKASEKFCDSFASAILLPGEKLKEAFGGWRDKVYPQELKMIKQSYGISLPAIMQRAFALDLISASHLKYFSIRYNQYYRTQEPFGYNGRERSDRFMQLIIRGIAQGIISSSKGAAFNNQSLSQFRSTMLDFS